VTDELDILLTRYFDGSASPEDVATLDRRVAADPSAAQALLSASRQDLALRGVMSRDSHGAVHSNAGATDIVHSLTVAARPIADHETSGWRLRSWRPWAAAASLLLVAGVIWFTIQANRSNPQQAASPSTTPAVTDAVATVEPLGPGVYIEHNGVSTPADRVATLSRSDRLHTGSSAGAVFSYPAEQTRISIGPAATVAIANEPSGKKLELITGVVDCQVEKQQPGKSMVIATSQARVKVVGTAFRVTTANQLTRIEVSHGTVRVTRAVDGATVDVSGGEFVDVGIDASTRPTAAAGLPVARGKNMAEFWSPRVRPAGINE